MGHSINNKIPIGLLLLKSGALVGLLTFFTFVYMQAPMFFGFIYLLAMLFIGGYLYWRDIGMYSAFTLLVWLISPGISRLLEWHLSGAFSELIILVPYVVTAFAWITLIKHIKGIWKEYSFPFLISAVGVLYGFIVGTINYGLFISSFTLLKWIIPVGYGLHLALSWRMYPVLRDNLHKLFIWGVLFTAAYAVLQFVFTPEWDRHWMQSVDMHSIGLPEPFEVRVFSTMNSPGPYAIFMMVGLIYLFGTSNIRNIRFAVIFIGFPAFLMTLVRSAWGGFSVGILLILLKINFINKIKIFMLILTVMVIITSILIFSARLEGVVDRLMSITSLEEDTSFITRVGVYKQVGQEVFLNPVGSGLGSLGGPGSERNSEAIMRFGALDSAFLEIPYTLGWFGGVFYLSGFFWLVTKMLKRSLTCNDKYLITYSAIVVALISQLLFSPVHRDVSGVLLWGVLGLALAGFKYHHMNMVGLRGFSIMHRRIVPGYSNS